ncbi:MAG: hypothetical protein WC725_02790 [Patescibacteria group bacterium]|jgi:hypothetical protein
MFLEQVKKYLPKVLDKAPKILLGVLLFVMIWFYMSNSFDTDGGWHMRFGQSVLDGQFPYRDTLTWSYHGYDWVNMSWGGDILFWVMYTTLGYQSQVILMTIVTFLAFILITALPKKEINWVGMAVAVFTLYLLDYTLIKRLSFFAPLFLAGLIYLLEGKIKKNIYWVLPAGFWLWAFLHGSWILGFITINIYVMGNLLQNLLHRYKPLFLLSNWNKTDFIRVIFAEILAFFVIAINPYGFRLFAEIMSVFTNPGPIKYILEFTPSYNYPIYFGSVICSVVILILALILVFRKKLTFAQGLLLIVFFISGIRYKRNIFYILFIGIPVLTGVAVYIWGEFEKSLLKNLFGTKKYRVGQIFLTGICLVSISFIYYFGSRVNISNDVWNNRNLNRPIILPFTAAKFLQNEVGNEPVRIFSEFNWTGYFEWLSPKAYYFLDGRTLRHPVLQKISLIDKYYAYYYDEGGLKDLENEQVKYILLRNISTSPLAKPDFLNQIFFGITLNKAYNNDPSQLEKDLRDNKDWILIYTDRMANIWKRK